MGVLGLGVYVATQDSIFPSVDVAVSMDRHQALDAARAHASEHGWGPETYRQVAWFTAPGDAETFFTYKGGRQLVVDLIDHGVMIPGQWCVRHFAEGKEYEGTVCFGPDGEFVGLHEMVPNDHPGAALTEDAARAVAREGVAAAGIDLGKYEVLITYEEERPSGRVDHIFIYRRSEPNPHGAHFDLSLWVSGDRLSNIGHYVELPEEWEGEYQRMRSRNRSLSIPGSTWSTLGSLMAALVILLTIGRQHAIRWRGAMVVAGLLAAARVITATNEFPQLGHRFDTALSWDLEVVDFWLNLPASGMGTFAFMTLTLAAADLVVRLGFPNHLDPFQLHRRDVLTSRVLWGLAVGGLAFTGPKLLYVLGFYGWSTQMHGWWYPSGMEYPADSIATLVPALDPLCTAFGAGMSEEWVFRALPMGIAAVLGKRFGRPALWIGAMIVVQALVFGSAHANYAQQPAYARVVELFLPYVIMGLVFVRFGIIPCVVAHITYDVVIMAQPLFLATAPGMGLQRALVICAVALPFLGILALRLLNGSWAATPDDATHDGWQPPPYDESTTVLPDRPTAFPRGWLPVSAVAALVGLGTLALPGATDFHSERLEIGRAEVVALAGAAVAKAGGKVDDWDVQSRVICKYRTNDERFVYDEGGARLMDAILGASPNPPICWPHWQVDFVRFGNPSVEKWHTYHRRVEGQDYITANHVVSEDAPGATLDEHEARVLALAELRDTLRIDLGAVEEVAVQSTQQENRLDWAFTYIHRGIDLGEGDVRLSARIQGDVVTNGAWIRVPEDWDRQRRRSAKPFSLVRQPVRQGLFLLMLGVVGLGLLRAVRDGLSRPPFYALILTVTSITVANSALSWPSTHSRFDVAEPVLSQAYYALIPGWVAALLGAVMVAAITVGHLQRRPPSLNSPPPWLVGLLLGAGLKAISSAHTGFELLTVGPGLAWRNYSSVEAVVPWLAVAVRSMEDYVFSLCILAAVVATLDTFTSGWTKWRIPGFLATMAFMLTIQQPQELGSWMSAGLAAAFFAAVCAKVFRVQFAAVATMAAIPVLVSLGWLAVEQPYPGAGGAAVLGMAMVCGLAWGAGRFLERPA